MVERLRPLAPAAVTNRSTTVQASADAGDGDNVGRHRNDKISTLQIMTCD